jgi:hypothetical protein
MEPNAEIRRLIDLMPASGRMTTKIVIKPEQAQVIDAPLPMPWNGDRAIAINIDLWQQLSRPQRDLALLRAVSWVNSAQWFKLGLPQVLAAAGILGGGAELFQADAVGLLMASGLSGLALVQLWRDNKSSSREIEADQAALRVAQRRGYSEPDAAQHLLGAIETIATLERRPGLNFIELLRCQNLRAIAGLSTFDSSAERL